jgi:hypothetical protein
MTSDIRNYRDLNARGLYLASSHDYLRHAGWHRYRIPAVYITADMLAIPEVASAIRGSRHTRLPKGGCIVFLRGEHTTREQDCAGHLDQVSYEAVYRRRVAEQGYFNGGYPISRRLTLGCMSHV